MTKLTKEEVKHISKLTNLNLAENELTKFGNQLGNILKFVEKLSAVDTASIAPLSHATGKRNVFREDKVEPSLPQEEALSNAPAKYEGYFKVKAIFEK